MRLHASCVPAHPLLLPAVGKRPDEKALQAVLTEVWRLLQTPGLDPAAARASFYLAAAAARANPAVRKQLATQVRHICWHRLVIGTHCCIYSAS